MDMKDNHQECMQVLHELALEIQEMDEEERYWALADMVRMELDGKGNNIWVIIAKHLLVKTELIPAALILVDREVNPNSNLICINVTPQQAPKNIGVTH